MIEWLKKLFSKKEGCTTCGRAFERLPWGGRVHYSRDGRTWSVHPIDYIITMNCKTDEESRAKIADLEKTERTVKRVAKR